MPRFQQGYLTIKSGAWIGHFSRWMLDHKTGQKIRRQHAFKIGTDISAEVGVPKDTLIRHCEAQ